MTNKTLLLKAICKAHMSKDQRLCKPLIHKGSFIPQAHKIKLNVYVTFRAIRTRKWAKRVKHVYATLGGRTKRVHSLVGKLSAPT